jgi:RimJ/RimL family protein N-acetyltransferase
MLNDPEIEKMVGGYSFPISLKQQKEWFSRTSNDANNIRLIIETKEDGSVGFANIVNIDWKNRSAFHGIKIANKSFQSRGIGTDTVMTVMRYCFEELNLHRLDGSIIEYNTPSQKLYINKCGWKIEGTKRQSIFKGNMYHNELIVSILKDEYEQLIKVNKYWEI